MEIGLFFGSFNPIHVGHLAIANYMVEYTGIEQVWFVVSPHNPLKEKSTLLADHQRLEMVRLAIGDDLRFRASDIEFKLPQPSYTTDTLAYLEDRYQGKRFALIMGSDNLRTIKKWKNYQSLIREYAIYVYPRPGYEVDPSGMKEIFEQARRIELTEAPMMEISSAFIRRSIRERKDMNLLIPPPVYNYIKEMHFYEKK
jgi:nicotinate-nucleotide adenylyltransferase